MTAFLFFIFELMPGPLSCTVHFQQKLNLLSHGIPCQTHMRMKYVPWHTTCMYGTLYQTVLSAHKALALVSV